MKNAIKHITAAALLLAFIIGVPASVSAQKKSDKGAAATPNFGNVNSITADRNDGLGANFAIYDTVTDSEGIVGLRPLRLDEFLTDFTLPGGTPRHFRVSGTSVLPAAHRRAFAQHISRAIRSLAGNKFSRGHCAGINVFLSHFNSKFPEFSRNRQWSSLAVIRHEGEWDIFLQ